jgi:hypothetical protein
MYQWYVSRSVCIIASILVLSTGIGFTTGDNKLLFTIAEAEFAQENASVSSTIADNKKSSIIDSFSTHGTISGIAADTMIGSDETLGSHSAG